MRTIVVKKSMIAKILGVEAIVLYPFIFCRSSSPSSRLITHELVHIEQIKRHGVLCFYWLYLKEYFHLRTKRMSHYEAYSSISFEKEAREREKHIG